MSSFAVEHWLKRFNNDSVPPRTDEEYIQFRMSMTERVQEIFVNHYFMVYRQQTIILPEKHKLVHNPSKTHVHHKQDSKIIFVRRWFKLLLNSHKPIRDQLLIEAPTLEGLRTGEVCSLRWEYIHADEGILIVLDSKKHVESPVPLDYTFYRHTMEYRLEQGLPENCQGYIFPPGHKRKLGNKSLGASFTEKAVSDVWSRCCSSVGIPRMEPRVGRAFFAVEQLVGGCTIYDVMVYLRHDDIQSTEHYLARIYDFELAQQHFYRGRESPFHSLSCCQHQTSCPFYQSSMKLPMGKKEE